jgi:NDP-sugar pyrophosphorylase family protein
MIADATVVILAGGKGTRLAPYTTVLPKPLMPVGDMPILEILIRQLRHYGFRNFVISVGHLSALIQAFFGDGSKWNVNIAYAIEDEPLGTIGPLRLIEGLTKPFLVMNGDLLTDLNFSLLYKYHRQGKQLATVATTIKQIQISLGVLETNNDRELVSFQEKPTHVYSASMGIYVYDPAVISLIPANTHYGFDNLMLDMLARGKVVRTYPFDGRWLDIGRPEDYEQASAAFERHRTCFLPRESSDE